MPLQGVACPRVFPGEREGKTDRVQELLALLLPGLGESVHVVYRKPRQKLIHFLRPHVPGMFHLMKPNEIANPVPIGFFCTDAVVVHPNNGANLIPKTGLQITDVK